MNLTSENHKSIAANIRAQYRNAGFEEKESNVADLLRFDNKFSEHFVFLFDAFEDLVENWQEEHNHLIETYQEYTGPENMEWNFYAIFICEDYTPNTGTADARSKIELDTTYSRKFVITHREIDSLPPGRITQEDFGKATTKETGLLANWQETLGEELFQALAECHKNAIDPMIKDYISQRKHGN